MNHPNDEQWVAFLYGEATEAEQKSLEVHLDQCDACYQHVETFRATMRCLDSWELPKPKPSPHRLTKTFSRSVAAAVLLGAGFLLGKATGVSRGDLEAIRSELAAAVQVSAETAYVQQARSLQDVWQTSRREDWLLLAEILDQQRKEQQAIRRDLETVAVTAEEAIARTQQDILQFVSLETAQYSLKNEERP